MAEDKLALPEQIDLFSSSEAGGNVFRRNEKKDKRRDALRKHKAWLELIRHEYPMPEKPYKIGVYIRYFNQTKYDNYLDYHKQEFADTIALCPRWTLVDFYVDTGNAAPRMENAKELCRLLDDCFAGKVDLVITQKVSNVSRDYEEIALMSRLLARQEHPVGIYFINEDLFTLASYYRKHLQDSEFLLVETEPQHLTDGEGYGIPDE